MLSTIINMRPNDHLRAGFIEFVDTLPPGCSVIEVGSYTGESAELFLRRAAIVVCVDRWKPYQDTEDGQPGGIQNMHAVEKLFDRRAALHAGRIVKCKCASPGAARLFADFSHDVVYLDAEHNEVATAEAIRAWIWKVRPGGILAGHDYDNPTCPGVKRAVDKMFGHPDRVFPDYTWTIKGGADGPIQRLVPGPVSGQPLSGTSVG